MSVITEWNGAPIPAVLPQYLDLCAWSEGTASGLDNGYGVIVSGVDGEHTFTDYSSHPFAGGRPAVLVRSEPPLRSTAAGRYQIILPTWKDLQTRLNLSDFSPLSQDLGALELIRERGAIEDILRGDIDLAIHLCSNIWASLPGNNYGQGGKRLDALLAQWSTMVDA